MGIDLLGFSWWMRLLCQTIATRADREDGETGKMAEALSGDVSQAPDRFLSPLELDEHGGEPGPCANLSGTRCSDKGLLSLSVAAYLELLDWTARKTVSGILAACRRVVQVPWPRTSGLRERR